MFKFILSKCEQSRNVKTHHTTTNFGRGKVCTGNRPANFKSYQISINEVKSALKLQTRLIQKSLLFRVFRKKGFIKYCFNKIRVCFFQMIFSKNETFFKESVKNLFF